MAVVPVVPLAAGAFVASQVMRAARRTDLPSFPNQDPSGVFGDPGSPPLRIVAVGDSSVTAPGVEDIDNVWIRVIARAMAETHHVTLISLAVGGAKARDVIEGQLDEAVRLRPTVASVSVGGNDALRGASSGGYRRRLTAIVERLAGTGAGVVVWGMGDLSSIPRLPATLRPYVSRRSRRFDDIARDVAAASPRAVKVYTRGRASAAFFDDPSLFAGDLFHAGDGGHRVFAEEAMPAFEEALSIGAASGG
jgi:lysophospholipase L1-like esterase